MTENVVSLTELTPTVRVLKKQRYQNLTKFKMFQLHNNKARVNNTKCPQLAALTLTRRLCGRLFPIGACKSI